MLTWPHADSDWASRLHEVEPVFIDISRAIARHEQLIITCFDKAQRQSLQQKFEQARIPSEAVSFYIHPSNDSWARDHGPLTVLENNQARLLDFEFNGWGGKYPAERDNQLNRALHAQGAFGATPMRHLPFVLEGGSIDSDGKGTLLTTTACLLSPSRNPSLNKIEIEEQLGHYLGARRVLWLEHGYLQGDDTDSHIDMLARFCNAETIAYSACDDETDAHFTALQAMAKALAEFRTLADEPYKLIPLPIPRAIFNSAGQRLPASYANFLIINQAVLVPQYHDPADEIACERLQAGFPDRQIIPINCLPIIQQYGSLHCLTMQLPQNVKLKHESTAIPLT